MTNREAFKYGFALRCADEALGGLAVADRLKAASALLEKASGIGDMIGPLATIGTVGAIGLPIAAGAAGGFAAQRMTEAPADVDDFKRQELIAELKHWTRRAKLQKQMKETV